MRYRVYGQDAISKEARPPLDIEADTEPDARKQAVQLGMEVLQVEPIAPVASGAAAASGSVERLPQGRQRPWIGILVALLGLVLVGGTVLAIVLHNRSKGRPVVEGSEDKPPSPEEMARRERYADQMRLVQRAWDDGQMGQVAELLDGLKPRTGETDLRGFEWHYLRALCHPELVSLSGLEHAAFSANGLLAGVQDGKVRVWDLNAWRETRSLPLPGAMATTLSLSGSASVNGSFLAAACPGKEGGPPVVKVWDLSTGKEALSFESPLRGDLLVALSPDGKLLAETSPANGEPKAPSTVRLVEVPAGKEVAVLKDIEQLTRVAFSPDGQRLATLSANKGIQLWAAREGKELLRLPGGEAAAFSPDGKQLAVGSAGGVALWDVELERDKQPAFGARIAGLAASPGGLGPWLVSAASLAVRPGRETASWKAPDNGAVKVVAFSPDGKRLATAGSDGDVFLWSAEGKQLFALRGDRQPVASLAFLGDDRRLVSAAGSTAKGWDITAPAEFTTPQGPSTSFWGGNWLYAWSGDSQLLAIATGSTSSSTSTSSFPPVTIWGKTISLWDVATETKQHDLFAASRYRKAVAMSRDGQHLAVATEDNRLRVLDRAGAVRCTWSDLPSPVTALAFAPEGGELAVGCEDGTVGSLDFQANRDRVWQGKHSGAVSSLAYSADGRRLTSVSRGRDPDLKVWDAQTARPLSSVKAPGGGDSVLSPTAGRVATIADKDVQLWDARTGKLLQTLKGHKESVLAVAFSPDGQRLATGAEDGLTILWDPFTARQLLVLKESSAVLLFSPDGKRLISTFFRLKVEGDEKFRWRSREDEQMRLRAGVERSDEDRKARWQALGKGPAAPEREVSDWGKYAGWARQLDKGEADQVIKEVTQAIEQGREEPWYWQIRGHAYAIQKQWDRAADDFRQAIERNRDDPGAWVGYLHIPLQQGDSKGYRQGCAEMLRHFDKGGKADANWLAWQCVFAPGSAADFAQPLRLAQDAVFRSRSWEALDTLGAVLFRAGDFKEAAARLEEAITRQGKGGSAGTWLFLAMTRQRLGEKEAAKTALDRALAGFDQLMKQERGAWDRRLEWQLLRREAEELVAGPAGK